MQSRENYFASYILWKKWNIIWFLLFFIFLHFSKTYWKSSGNEKQTVSIKFKWLLVSLSCSWIGWTIEKCNALFFFCWNSFLLPVAFISLCVENSCENSSNISSYSYSQKKRTCEWKKRKNWVSFHIFYCI